jgi:hypothetical protein
MLAPNPKPHPSNMNANAIKKNSNKVQCSAVDPKAHLGLEPPLFTSYTYGVLIVASQEVSAIVETITTFL